MWNEASQVYQLDFGGRVTQESAKNFQIEYRDKQVSFSFNLFSYIFKPQHKKRNTYGVLRKLNYSNLLIRLFIEFSPAHWQLLWNHNEVLISTSNFL